jgi:hypothetical protein
MNQKIKEFKYKLCHLKYVIFSPVIANDYNSVFWLISLILIPQLKVHLSKNKIQTYKISMFLNLLNLLILIW